MRKPIKISAPEGGEEYCALGLHYLKKLDAFGVKLGIRAIPADMYLITIKRDLAVDHIFITLMIEPGAFITTPRRGTTSIGAFFSSSNNAGWWEPVKYFYPMVNAEGWKHRGLVDYVEQPFIGQLVPPITPSSAFPLRDDAGTRRQFQHEMGNLWTSKHEQETNPCNTGNVDWKGTGVVGDVNPLSKKVLTWKGPPSRYFALGDATLFINGLTTIDYTTVSGLYEDVYQAYTPFGHYVYQGGSARAKAPEVYYPNNDGSFSGYNGQVVGAALHTEAGDEWLVVAVKGNDRNAAPQWAVTEHNASTGEQMVWDYFSSDSAAQSEYNARTKYALDAGLPLRYSVEGPSSAPKLNFFLGIYACKGNNTSGAMRTRKHNADGWVCLGRHAMEKPKYNILFNCSGTEAQMLGLKISLDWGTLSASFDTMVVTNTGTITRRRSSYRNYAPGPPIPYYFSPIIWAYFWWRSSIDLARATHTQDDTTYIREIERAGERVIAVDYKDDVPVSATIKMSGKARLQVDNLNHNGMGWIKSGGS